MDNKNILNVLSSLAQLDIDAAAAYEQALKNIDDQTIYDKINKFYQEHLQHIDELNRCIALYGGDPLKRNKDFKGYLIEGFTSLRSITGTKGALSAMETNEKLTNKTYHNAINDNPDLPLDVRAVLNKNYGDEQAHLTYIQQTLNLLKIAS